MKCQFCANGDTQVIETRETSEDVTRRRRECLKCERRFTTYERQEHMQLRVIKRDGNHQMFDREKLRRGLLKSVEKRPVTAEQIDQTVDEIEKKLLSKGKQDIKSEEIGELVMQKLKKLDQVAYIRFASVYKNFEDAGDFAAEIKSLNKK